MRNWDESEEKGNQNCSVEQDLRDAQHICKHLDIPLHEADFIDQYWNRVFSHFVTQYSKGLTPNPDLECNRSIKFDALLQFAKGLGAETVATGHYARLVKGEDGTPLLHMFLSSQSAQSPLCYGEHLLVECTMAIIKCT